MRPTRKTLLEIIRRTRARNQQEIVEKAHEFAIEAVRIVKSEVADQLVGGIRYEQIGQWYEMAQFEAEIESWQSYLEPAEKSLYNQ